MANLGVPRVCLQVLSPIDLLNRLNRTDKSLVSNKLAIFSHLSLSHRLEECNQISVVAFLDRVNRLAIGVDVCLRRVLVCAISQKSRSLVDLTLSAIKIKRFNLRVLKSFHLVGSILVLVLIHCFRLYHINSVRVGRDAPS